MDIINTYQAANSDKESVKRDFIVRKIEFDIIIDSLSMRNPGDSLQYELILGRRGSGKSTLLKRIEIEIEEKFYERYIPVNLAEEQASIYRLSDLWLEVIKELECRLKINIDLTEYKEFKKDQDYTRYLYAQIHEFCENNRKQIVLLLDNFDRIVENFDDDGNLLREMLINYNDIAIVATSTRMDEHFWQYDKPFYEFFRRHHLNALNINEIKNLIKHWSETMQLPELDEFAENNPGKIQSVRIITDGMPRTLLLFIRLIINNNYADEGVDYLKKIMDEVTPLYQERLNSLPSQLRKIVSEMAFIWEACTTNDLVDKCRMESKLISANLTTLALKGIVEKIETNKRFMLYRISERFFNMWLIMTQGNPEQKRKAKWLSIFLEAWHTPNELKNLAFQHIEALKNKDKSGIGGFIMSKALSQSKYISTYERDQIIELTPSDMFEDRVWEMPELYLNIAGQIIESVNSQNYKKAISLAKSIENEEDGVKFFALGHIYDLDRKIEEAERYYLLAIEKGHVGAMFNIAILYANQERKEEAERYYLLAVEKGYVSAMFNLAILYVNQERKEEAEKYYLLAIEKEHVSALNNLAHLYENQKRKEEAERYYLLAIEKGDVNAMFNLAHLYENQKRIEEAERYYLFAIEKGDVGALNNLALLYANQNRKEEAEMYYLLAIEKGYVAAMYNLVVLYYNNNIKKYDALKYIRLYNEQFKHENPLLIMIELWNGIFNNLEKRTFEMVKRNDEYLSFYIRNLIIHQQKTLVFNLFNNPDFGEELQNKFAVLYYVCLLLNNKTDDNFNLKVPPEIESTVRDMLNIIKDKERFFGYEK